MPFWRWLRCCSSHVPKIKASDYTGFCNFQTRLCMPSALGAVLLLRMLSLCWFGFQTNLKMMGCLYQSAARGIVRRRLVPKIHRHARGEHRRGHRGRARVRESRHSDPRGSGRGYRLGEVGKRVADERKARLYHSKCDPNQARRLNACRHSGFLF